MIGKIRSLFASNWLRYGVIAVSGLIVLMVVFGAGFAAGRWSTFPLVFLSRGPRDFAFRTGHGAVGTIQAVDGQRITIQSRDGKLETILVSNETKFDKNFEKISFSDLKLNDHIIVIGSPNDDGEINARLVGLVDPSSFRFLRDVPFPTRSK